ncbi:MAG: SRPBCC family protein [Alphaproteobacteria bacterium]|nr:SRPBCC family protein [Alphaproteobacteria bacterium]
MRHAAAALSLTALLTPAAFAEPEYVTIAMQIDVAKPAAEAWARVGDYCDIVEWFPNLSCRIVSGDGGIGTVRAFNPEGTAIEVLTAKTELSYGYVQPLRADRPYNLYHGFLEARPVTATTSRLLYTLVYDVSMLADQTAKNADVSRRRGSFEAALAKMKAIAETK